MKSASSRATLTRHGLSAVVVSFAVCLTVTSPPSELRAAASLPSEISDQEFWTLTEQLSEPNGFFRSDNFLSNELGFPSVLPDLASRRRSGSVYLGVGPEQNFSYIVALRPQMAFIIDIRRGNLQEHLLYKALFELSTDRADFLGRLFSRERPSGLSRQSTVEQLFAAYDNVQASDDRYKRNLKDVIDSLTRKHHFKLSDEDLKGIDYVYHDAFYLGGPFLNYSMGRGRAGGNMPTYQQLMLASDGRGQNRSYLAAEESFAFLKDLETRNLIVPVVGNFGGPKAIRAVGEYVKNHGGTVVAFYLSNVEQFLSQDGIWGKFCASVATLPLDQTSTFIYTGRGAPIGNTRGGRGFGQRGGGGLQQTNLRPMLSEVKTCAAR